MAPGCAGCQKPVATPFFYPKCKEAPKYLDHERPIYCSQEHQRGVAEQQKFECEVLVRRLAIHRAADIIQQVFIKILRQTWEIPIERVEKSSGSVVFIHEAYSPVHKLQGFPKLKSGDKEPHLPTLMFNMCNAAIRMMRPVLEHMCGDDSVPSASPQSSDADIPKIVDEIFGYRFHAKGRKLWLFMVAPDGEVYADPESAPAHEIFRLRAGTEEYALDLSHMQYGHVNETLMEWPVCLKNRVLREVSKPSTRSSTSASNSPNSRMSLSPAPSKPLKTASKAKSERRGDRGSPSAASRAFPASRASSPEPRVSLESSQSLASYMSQRSDDSERYGGRFDKDKHDKLRIALTEVVLEVVVAIGKIDENSWSERLKESDLNTYKTKRLKLLDVVEKRIRYYIANKFEDNVTTEDDKQRELMTKANKVLKISKWGNDYKSGHIPQGIMSKVDMLMDLERSRPDSEEEEELMSE